MPTQPTIPDFIAGTAPTPAIFDGWVQSPLAFLTTRVVFRAELSSGTTWVNGSNTLIPYNVIDEDPFSGWSSGTHSWTPPADYTGTYEISITASSTAAGDNTTSLRTLFLLNGASLYITSAVQASQTQSVISSGTVSQQLFGGQDNVSAAVLWTSSGNGTAVTTSGQRCTMEITWESL